MAGKTWSEVEEEYFWVHIIPFSRRRRGIDLANAELSFQQLAEKMHAAFGEDSRRQYTALTLGKISKEHFYQNIETGRISKNAHKWVKQYKALANEYPSLPEKTNRATREVNNEFEPAHVRTKASAETDWELGGDENAEKRAAILKQATRNDHQESDVQAEGTGAEGDELFAGPAGTNSPGYNTSRNVTDASGAIGGTDSSRVEETVGTVATMVGIGYFEGSPAHINAGAQGVTQDTIIVGGFSFPEDDLSMGEDSDDQQDDNESADQ